MYVHLFSYICSMNNIKLFVTALFAMIVSIGASAQEVYKINTSTSKMEWVGKKIGGQHSGDVKFESGSVAVKGGKVTTGDATINMNTINTTDLQGEWKDKLDGHLKDGDFFNVAEFPTSAIKVTKVAYKKGKGTNAVITGMLTIKGKTNPIIFPATISVKDGKVTINATLTIDRTKWGINYGSGSIFKEMADKAINDIIEFTLNIQAEK